MSYETVDMKMQIEKGVIDGYSIRFPKFGNEDPNANAGDLVIIVKELPHPVFRRIGADLYTTIVLNLTESLIGFNRSFMGLGNKTLEIKRSTVTFPGTKDTLYEEGFMAGEAYNRLGNIIVEYQYELPSYLSNEKKIGKIMTKLWKLCFANIVYENIITKNIVKSMSENNSPDLSICEEKPELLTKLATYSTHKNDIVKESPSQFKSREMSNMANSKINDIIEEAKYTINELIVDKNEIYLRNSEKLMEHKALCESFSNLKKQYKTLSEKRKMLNKLLSTTQKRHEDDMYRLKQYVSISGEMFNENTSVTTRLKEEYDVLAVSINKHLNAISTNRSKYPSIVGNLKKDTSKYDALNMAKFKEIDNFIDH